MRAKLRELMFTKSGRQILSLDIEGDFREGFDKLADKLLDVELKVHRERRSKNANDYLWVLCTKIAESQGIGAVEVYRKQIEEVGVFEDMAIREEKVKRWCEVWAERGIGWFCRVVDNSYPGYKRVRCYYGSSTYNTAEMSRLINNTIDDARALGIETASLSELALLLDNWEEKKK